MKRYEAYKHSGVDWIGEIPEGWEVRRIKTLFKEINERSFDGSEDLLSVSQYTGVTKKSDKVEEGDLLTNASTLEGYKIVRNGDLVSNIMLAWNGSLGFSQHDGITSPAYSIYRLKSKGEKQFFHYLFRTEKYKAEFKRQSSGVIESRLRLYSDDFFSIYSILPPLPEQTAIANFLDDKIAKIEQTIGIRQKEIELLKERRQILIQQAVTKGLDATVPMKDNGVDWIGEIPEHWEVRKLKYVFDIIKTGTTPQTARQEYFDGEINWFNPKDLNNEILLEAEKSVTELAIKDKEVKLFPGDSILIVGIGATSGKTAYSLKEGTFNQQITGFHSKKDNNKFYYYFFKCVTELMLNLATYTTLPILNNEFFKSFLTIKPPLDEQKQIVIYLEDIEAKVSKAITLKEQEIEKLKEYKTVLIDNVVTGKVKINL